MKTLTLSSLTPKDKSVALDIQSDRICSFCGENVEKAVTGSVELKVEVPKTEPLDVPYKTEYVRSLFGKSYTKILASSYRLVVIGGEYRERKDTADICFSCIHQLAKLVPKV